MHILNIIFTEFIPNNNIIAVNSPNLVLLRLSLTICRIPLDHPPSLLPPYLATQNHPEPLTFSQIFALSLGIVYQLIKP